MLFVCLIDANSTETEKSCETWRVKRKFLYTPDLSLKTIISFRKPIRHERHTNM